MRAEEVQAERGLCKVMECLVGARRAPSGVGSGFEVEGVGSTSWAGWWGWWGWWGRTWRRLDGHLAGAGGYKHGEPRCGRVERVALKFERGPTGRARPRLQLRHVL